MNSQRMKALDGTESSRITSFPPGLRTRSISLRPFSRFSKFLTPNATVTRSKLLSGNLKFSQSPVSQDIKSSSPALATLSFITSSIPSERSTPVTWPIASALPDPELSFASFLIASAMAMLKSPVPQATSSTSMLLRRRFSSISLPALRSSLVDFSILLRALFLQLLSMSRDIIWFSLS